MESGYIENHHLSRWLTRYKFFDTRFWSMLLSCQNNLLVNLFTCWTLNEHKLSNYFSTDSRLSKNVQKEFNFYHMRIITSYTSHVVFWYFYDVWFSEYQSFCCQFVMCYCKSVLITVSVQSITSYFYIPDATKNEINLPEKNGYPE